MAPNRRTPETEALTEELAKLSDEELVDRYSFLWTEESLPEALVDGVVEKMGRLKPTYEGAHFHVVKPRTSGKRLGRNPPVSA